MKLQTFLRDYVYSMDQTYCFKIQDLEKQKEVEIYINKDSIPGVEIKELKMILDSIVLSTQNLCDAKIVEK